MLIINYWKKFRKLVEKSLLEHRQWQGINFAAVHESVQAFLHEANAYEELMVSNQRIRVINDFAWDAITVAIIIVIANCQC